MTRFLFHFRRWVVMPIVVLVTLPLLPVAIAISLLYSAVVLCFFIIYYITDPVMAKRWWRDRG